MILFGFVKSKVLSDDERQKLQNGNYVIFEGSLATVQDQLYHLQIYPTGEKKILEEQETLKYEKVIVEVSDAQGTQHQFPLKFGQWKGVVANRLLNSDTRLTIELLEVFPIKNNYLNSTKFVVARLLNKNHPWKYTEKDARKLVEKAILDIITYLKDQNIEATVTHEYMDQWWNENKIILPE